MRFVVFGGAGFIGAHFANVAARRGHEVVVVDKLTYAADLKRLESLSGNLEFIKASTSEVNLYGKAITSSDIVVNFAAETHVDNSIANPKSFFESNVMEFLPLIDFAASKSLRFHHVSTDEVLGDLPLGRGEFNETSPYNPSSPYSSSKAAADMAVRAWGRTYGLRFTISICSNNYGIWQHPEKFIPKSMNSILEKRKPVIYGTGLNERDWIHVEDHVEGIFCALDRGQIGETYLFGGQNVLSNLQVITKICQILDWPVDMLEFTSDRAGHDRRYAIDISRTSQALGWVPQKNNFEVELAHIAGTEVSDATD